MNVYLLSQNVNNSYNTYDSMVIIANSEEEAIQYSVDKYPKKYYSCWASFEDIECTLIGTAIKKYEEITTVCSSFNAG